MGLKIDTCTGDSIVATLPAQPSPGDVVMFCVHRPDIGNAHFFYMPNDGWIFRRPDGSMGGPVRWIVMCNACCNKYRHNATLCPCDADLEWPEDLPLAISRRTDHEVS